MEKVIKIIRIFWVYCYYYFMSIFCIFFLDCNFTLRYLKHESVPSSECVPVGLLTLKKRCHGHSLLMQFDLVRIKVVNS